MADLAAHGEQVDLLVNNAGFGLTGPLRRLDGQRQRQMIDLNCGALTELAHAVLPAMIERKSGAILNVASTAAFQPGPAWRSISRPRRSCCRSAKRCTRRCKRHGVTRHRAVPRPDRDRIRRGRRLGAGTR